MRLSKGVVNGLYFLGGALIGSVVTVFVTKMHYQRVADEQIEAVEKAFGERLDEVEGEKDRALSAASDAIINSNEYNKEDPGSRDFITTKSTLDGMFKASEAERVDYTKYYKGEESNVDLNENGDISIEEPKRPGEDWWHIIDADSYGGRVGYDYKELYFYVGDGILVDDTDDILDNPSYLLGNAIEETGFRFNDEKDLYVRNDSCSCDYQVIKVLGSYSDGEY